MEHVFVIIISFNTKDGVIDLLSKLTSQNNNVTFVVVDNASTDGTESAIRQHFPNVLFIQNKANIGYVKSVNVGLQFAIANRATNAIVFSPNLTVSDGFIDAMLAKPYDVANPVFIRHSHGVGTFGIGGRIKGRLKKPFYAWQSQQLAKSFNTTPQFASLVCFGIRLAAIKKAGFFDETFGQFFADVAYASIAKKLGLKVGIVPTAEVIIKTPKIEQARFTIMKQQYRKDASTYYRRQTGFGSWVSRLLSLLLLRFSPIKIEDIDGLAFYEI